MTNERLPPGSSSDRYVVLRLLAEGGMGAIYLGKKLGAPGSEHEVVLKQLLPELMQQQAFVDLFLREARISAALEHPNIVRTLDLVRSEDDLFMVMEYVRGGDLRTLERRAKLRRRRFPKAAALQLACDVLAALAYAHAKVDDDGRPLRLIHRDVSPANVLVSGSGVAKLTDFGIAKAATHESVFYQVRGKVGYMSPEQARGDVLDARSDLYSASVCLYEMLTGERLFVESGITATPDAIYRQPISPVSQERPDLPRALDAIMAKALAFDPADRYQSAAELREVLQRVALHAGLPSDPAAIATMLAEACGPIDEWATATVRRPRHGDSFDDNGLETSPGTDKLSRSELAEALDSMPGAGYEPDEVRLEPVGRQRAVVPAGKELSSVIRFPTAAPTAPAPGPAATGRPDSAAGVADPGTPRGPAGTPGRGTPLGPGVPGPDAPLRPAGGPGQSSHGTVTAMAAFHRHSRLPGWMAVLLLAAGVCIVVAIGLSGPEIPTPTIAPLPTASKAAMPSPTATVPARSSVAVNSDPVGGRVTAPGQESCLTPCQLVDLPSGSAVVRVEKPGYLPWTQLVVPRADAGTSVQAKLRPRPAAGAAWGRVRVRTPAPADVMVNGELIGHVTTEGPIDLPAGAVELAAVGPDGRTSRSEVAIRAGATIEVELR